MQNFDGVDRCCYYKGSVCESVLKFCKGEHFLDKSEGLSLYALFEWMKRLPKSKWEYPIIMEWNNDRFAPLIIAMVGNRDGFKWVIYCER